VLVGGRAFIDVKDNSIDHIGVCGNDDALVAANVQPV